MLYHLFSLLFLLLPIRVLEFINGTQNNAYSSSPLIANLSGTTSGSFNVSEVGSATYSIPIITSPGTAGMQPSLTLSYSSSGGNGLLGLGWSVIGISTIQRSSKTLAQDGEIDGISFDGGDSYSLDGERLILVSGRYGADGSQYSTEQNVQMRITAKGTTPGFTSPAGFEVRTKAGLIMEYGNSTDSRIEAQGTNTAIFWCIKRISDTKGNYMTFTYREDTREGEYYPARIDYTGNENTGLRPYNSIVFNYLDRVDDTPRFIYGSKIVATKVLSSIDCLHENKLVRRYSFEYELGAFSRISLLKSIQECGTDASQCLPPTYFKYENEKPLGLNIVTGSPIPPNDLNGNFNKLLQGDWNGDGINDFMRYSTKDGGNIFYLNKGNFNFTERWVNIIPTSSINKGYIQPLDMNTDGYTDIWWMDPVSGTNIIFINNKKDSLSFTPNSNIIPPKELAASGNNIVEPRFADWNGDGRIDIMTFIPNSGRNRFFLNNSSSNDPPKYNLFKQSDIIPGALISISSDMELLTGDWDNDGLTDLLWVNRKANSSGRSNRWIRNTGKGIGISFQIPTISNADIDLRGGTGITFGDWNGDGLSDLLWYDNNNGETRWWYNKGNLSFIRASARIAPELIEGSQAQYYLLDFNGDAASDLIVYEKESGKNHWFTNDGNLDFTKPLNSDSRNTPGYLNPIPKEKLQNATALNFSAFSGKGGLDLLWLNTNASLDNNRWFETTIKPHFQLKEVVNGLGYKTSIQYLPLTDTTVYKKEYSAIYPFLDFNAPLQVVASYEIDNGIGGKTKVTNRYIGGIIHLNGRGFRGFAEIHQTDVVSGITNIRYFNRDHRFISSPLERSETRLASGHLIGETKQIDTLITFYNKKAFVSHTVVSETKDFELSKKIASNVRTKMRYDDYGNVLESVVNYGDGHIDSTINYYKSDNVSRWLLGRLTRSEVFKKSPGQQWVKRTASFEYNSLTGLLIKEITEPDLPKEQQIIKEYLHDAYGNIVESKLHFFNGEDFETRVTKTIFDNKGRFTVIVKNALGHAKITEYDPLLGHPIKEVDPNGLTTIYEYDPLGRLIKTTFPDGNWVTTGYKTCLEGECPENSVFYTVQRSSLNPEEHSYFDMIGREVMSRTTGFDSTVIIKKTEYNARGLLSRVSAPYFEYENPVWTIFKYDTLGREIERIEPGNRVFKTQYDGLITTSINPLNQVISTRKDVPGRVVEVIDNAKSVIRFNYDAYGNLLNSIDPKGNRIEFEYDLYSNKTRFSDPDMGVYRNEYNAIGELKKITNPKGEITTYKYDLLGRAVLRVEPEGQTVWTYDSQTKGIGLPAFITSPGYRKDFTYDSLSRLRQQTEIINGKSFRIENSYDSKGRLGALKYPGDFSVRYVYNKQNYLTEVRDNVSGSLFWKADQVNARNQLERSSFGNGVSSRFTYDPTTFWLTNIRTNRTQTNIQDLSYSYNEIGVLVQRINGLQGKTESFSYDNLNRLSKVLQSEVVVWK